MNRLGIMLAATALAAAGLAAGAARAADKQPRDRVRYETNYKDPVLEAMGKAADSLAAVDDSLTSAIQKQHRDQDKKQADAKQRLRFDWSRVVKPASPEVFKPPFHYPPHRQYRTGTCWCFSTTSFFETEMQRLHGKPMKLSEMHTVYWEYVEKARGYIAKRGCQPFSTGSEADAVTIIWKKYGAVPATVYSGLPPGVDKYDDEPLCAEMASYLEWAKSKNQWDEATLISQIRAILDRTLGPPPTEFDYEGRRYTPQRFLAEVVRLPLDDYVQLMSTLSVPFYTWGEFDVPDNWRPTATYYNVPLDDFYACITRATSRGHTLAIGGDVSEPGLYGFEDAAIVPTFDIPSEYIDQDAREFRFDNHTTGDDHGIHLLAATKAGGHDWFLIKDSSASSNWGKHKGYYFYRDDFVKLKMLSFMVHKDIAQPLLAKAVAPLPAAGR